MFKLQNAVQRLPYMFWNVLTPLLKQNIPIIPFDKIKKTIFSHFSMGQTVVESYSL